MIAFDLSLRIARPPEDVFAFWSDPERIPRWQGSAEDVCLDAPPGPGCSWTVTRRTLGTRQAMKSRYTAFEAGRRLVEEGQAGPATTVIETRFLPDGSGTRVETRVSVELGGALGRLGEKLASGSIRKQAQEDQARLKALIEAS